MCALCCAGFFETGAEQEADIAPSLKAFSDVTELTHNGSTDYASVTFAETFNNPLLEGSDVLMHTLELESTATE